MADGKKAGEGVTKVEAAEYNKQTARLGCAEELRSRTERGEVGERSGTMPVRITANNDNATIEVAADEGRGAAGERAKGWIENHRVGRRTDGRRRIAKGRRQLAKKNGGGGCAKAK